MAITKKQQVFIDEYFIDFNATQAAIRAGYSKKTAYSQGGRLLKHVEIKAEIDQRMKEGRISTDEIIKRIEAMMLGELPTKRVIGSNERIEYDVIGATDRLGKIYALFVDKQQIENIDGLEIVDEESED